MRRVSGPMSLRPARESDVATIEREKEIDGRREREGERERKKIEREEKDIGYYLSRESIY